MFELENTLGNETELSNVFLAKHDDTLWSDSENYFSDFSDLKFSDDEYFISFFDIDSTVAYCEGWKIGETIYYGVKWKIEVITDTEDTFWFRFDYYGFAEEIEYSVSDGLLFYSNSNSDSFTFATSEKNYSESFLDTGEIIKLEGCTFY